MKILLISNGRTSDENLKNQLLDFNKRLSHYIDFNHFEIPSLKSSNKLSKLEYKNQAFATQTCSYIPYIFIFWMYNNIMTLETLLLLLLTHEVPLAPTS